MYCTSARSHGKCALSTQPIDLSWEVGGLTDRPIRGGVISILIYCNGLLSLLLLSLSLCHPLLPLLFFPGDVTSSEAVKWSRVLCCPSSVAAAHTQTVIIFCQGRDQCGEQSAHKTPLWQSDWFVQNMFHVHTHTHTQRQTGTQSQADRHISTHTHTNCNFSSWLSCHAVIIPREKVICLLMQQMLSVFWQFKKKRRRRRNVYMGSMQSHVVLLLLTAAQQHSHI